MTQSIRAPAAQRRTLAALVLCAIAAGGGTILSGQTTSPASTTEQAELYRTVKAFDFNERPLGNFEDTPMYWRRMTGDGLPAYSDGRFDDDFGYLAPPSFVFTLQGGNIGYEYGHTDLGISPDSDYLIKGYVRAEGLEYARALIACYLVDQAGQRIAGSQRVSRLVRSETETGTEPAEDWQRVEIPLHVEYPNAHTVRVQLWVLQTHVFQEPDETAVDPIIRQEVDARVWFDDIAIVRMPRVRLKLSNPGGIVKPGAQETLHVHVHNATLATLRAEVTIQDATNTERFSTGLDLAPQVTEELHVPVPPLPPGMYRADVRLIAGSDAAGEADRNTAGEAQRTTLLHRAIRFAVLPELGAGAARFPEFGLDLGRWRYSDLDGPIELITTLGCGAIKVGLPVIGTPRDEEEANYLRQIRDLARRLALRQIESTGVLLSPSPANQSGGGLSTYRMFMTDPAWDDRVGSVFAHCGGHLMSWQLGREPLELREPVGWNVAAIEQVRQKLERFVAVPQLVVPRSVFDTGPTPRLLYPPGMLPPEAEAAVSDTGTQSAPMSASQRPYAYSVWLPAELPAWAFPWHLAFCLDPEGDHGFEAPVQGPRPGDRGAIYWLSLGLQRSDRTLPADRLADLARRIVLASVVNPNRLYVPAPFELSMEGGGVTWQPTDEYIPLRTLLHHLSGKRAVASMAFAHHAVAVLFGGAAQHTVIVWTWQQEAEDTSVELYIGPAASAIDLSGVTYPLQCDGARARVPLAPTPLIIEGVDAPLLLLQDSFCVEPSSIQLHQPEPRPVLTLRNHYATELAGTIELHPPPTWQVSPNPIQVRLAAGETLAQPLYFTIPPRQVASEQTLGVDVRLLRPIPVELHFEPRLQVKLNDIVVKAAIWWDGNDLVVEQRLHNLSSRPASFNAFCQPLQRAQLEGVFLNVPPGDVRLHVYRLPAARDLAGTRLWMGIQEIDGDRMLDQLVAVPQ